MISEELAKEVFATIYSNDNEFFHLNFSDIFN
jgi:hypothetical protein